MACRKVGLREDQKQRNAAASVSAAVSDALLFATMCIIGLPVEVHARDGSVYSGTFHTASVDNQYAIVLKQARMMKKGNQDTNVTERSLIETLIVQSEDLVQVVAKGVRLPSNGITGSNVGDGLQATVGNDKYVDRVTKVTKSNECKENKKHKNHSRYLAKRANGFSDSKAANVMVSSLEEHNGRLNTPLLEQTEGHNASVDGRQVGNCSQEIQGDNGRIPKPQDGRMTAEVQGSNSRITGSEAHSTADEERGPGRLASEDPACTATSPSNVSTAPISIVDAKLESRLCTSSNSFSSIPPKNSSCIKSAKESKLNPGAKTFCPSDLQNRAATPPLVPNGASFTYVPETYKMTPTVTDQQEFDPSPYSHPSVPVKFVPYNNATTGIGGNDYTPYAQPIIGQVVSRTQPVRYAGQCNNFQLGPAYIHPSPQNVMHGRVGPLVCMHPISSDVVQSEASFTPATARPLLTPHQMHLPKHQGNALGQGLHHLCMNPPLMANGAQQFVMPNSIPFSQPLYPMLRPIAVPGSNGFLSTKYA